MTQTLVHNAPILPGATLGVLGSGQLGRMFAIAARQMGYRVATFSPDYDSPTGQVADREVQADYNDLDAVREFAKSVSVVTFEFENVPAETAAAAAQFAPVRPNGNALHITQHRLREKTFLAENGIPVTKFRVVRSADELARALVEVGTPAVLKTAGFGYDGKGQIKIASPEQANSAWQALKFPEAVLEAWVTYAREVSMVGVRGLDGEFRNYGLIHNRHENHILDMSFAPATANCRYFDERIVAEAEQITRAIMEKLEVVGVLCVEFFALPDGRLLVNELAPRPHNSGHLTIDAARTSQFEQQVRAICGLPLGSTGYDSSACMVNLLGDLWADGEPNWFAALTDPNARLHLYGKISARPGRKMGHLTVRGSGWSDPHVAAMRARWLLTHDSLDGFAPPTDVVPM